jgi:hypothetical protein
LKIKLVWVKAHVGIYGNELVDKLAKEAARSDSTKYEYSRIHKRAIIQEAAELAIQKLQTEWSASSKAAATRQYFLSVREIIGLRINLTPKLTAVPSGHGMTTAYHHRLKLREEAEVHLRKRRPNDEPPAVPL